MLLRLLIRYFMNWIVGDPDRVQQDRTTWPTWLVVVIMLAVLGGLAGAYVALT